VNISYKHAWLLLKEIEDSVGEPVIITKRGGKDRGTFLTEKAKTFLRNIIHIKICLLRLFTIKLSGR